MIPGASNITKQVVDKLQYINGLIEQYEDIIEYSSFKKPSTMKTAKHRSKNVTFSLKYPKTFAEHMLSLKKYVVRIFSHGTSHFRFQKYKHEIITLQLQRRLNSRNNSNHWTASIYNNLKMRTGLCHTDCTNNALKAWLKTDPLKWVWFCKNKQWAFQLQFLGCVCKLSRKILRSSSLTSIVSCRACW